MKPKKTKRLDKEEALRLMLDGYPVIPMTEPSKQQYQGEFYCYWNDTFIYIGVDRTEDVDVNNLPSEFWQTFEIPESEYPRILYRTNIKQAEVIEMEFTSVYTHSWNWDPRHKLYLPTTICEYKSIKTGLIYSVKFNFEAKTLRKSVKAMNIIIDTDKVETTKTNAYWWFRNYVEEQLQIQKKRSGRKEPIKSMEIVALIQEKYPQAFI